MAPRSARAGQLLLAEASAALLRYPPPRRSFHEYFVTHLPKSSLHPDARSAAGPRHQLPRSASKPHTSSSPGDPEPAPAPTTGTAHSRDTTVVRIPLRSAKHHFGASISRGQRPYNEDAYQAGVIELPAFSKRNPLSVSRAPASSPLQAYRERQQKAQETATEAGIDPEEGRTSAIAANGDPQVFFFGVYDGHGGAECSGFLQSRLHEYIESAATDFQLQSTLQTQASDASAADDHQALDRAKELEESLVNGWKVLVGGYFRRFRPAHFQNQPDASIDISTILTYAFLRADFEFIQAQARKSDTDADSVMADAPLNASDVLHSPSAQIGGTKRFRGGSTCSVALVSTPTPVPFWHPSTPSTLMIAHVGDTRILLCRTSDGLAEPVTIDHHPSNPDEGKRLRRYAGNIVTDSFGEERISGLANTRAFGDMGSKRIGVSAEPEIRRVELAPAQYSFMVLMSDGVSGTLSDQEVLDIVKEAKTPEQGARDVVAFATEVSDEGDNATCICIRLGGWERRSEGGLGSLGTRESREYRRQDAADPRRRR
jgi:protein phosphatase PTC6